MVGFCGPVSTADTCIYCMLYIWIENVQEMSCKKGRQKGIQEQGSGTAEGAISVYVQLGKGFGVVEQRVINYRFKDQNTYTLKSQKE